MWSDETTSQLYLHRRSLLKPNLRWNLLGVILGLTEHVGFPSSWRHFVCGLIIFTSSWLKAHVYFALCYVTAADFTQSCQIIVVQLIFNGLLTPATRSCWKWKTNKQVMWMIIYFSSILINQSCCLFPLRGFEILMNTNSRHMAQWLVVSGKS